MATTSEIGKFNLVNVDIMKTLFLFLIMVLTVGLVSCSNDRAEDVSRKISEGQTLSQDDYRIIINYLGEYAEKAQPIQDAIDALPVGSDEAFQKSTELADLAAKYKFSDVFSTALGRATAAEVGSDNVKLVDRYAPYFWFTAPDWATVNGDSDIEGFIEDMPSDTASVSNEVVSYGDGVAVE